MLRACAPLLLLSAITAQEVRESLDTPDERWQGAVAIEDGATGQAARFSGGHAWIDVGPCPVDSKRPFTLRCSIRTDHGGFCTPLMARHVGAVGLSLVLGREPGRISFEAWSWQSVRLLSETRIDDGKWHRIEVSYDPGSTGAVLIVDGKLQAMAVLGDGSSPHSRLRLGNNIGANQPFAGDLDQVEITATATNAAMFRHLAPVVPASERRAALAHLREQTLPRTTLSLASDTADEWARRRGTVRRHVADALGLLPPPENVPFDIEIHGELEGEGVLLQRVSWIGFPGKRATGWLWSPDPKPEGRLPTVLCPHGHWANGARHPVVQARCAAFARFGWIALAVDSVHVEDVASGVNSVGAMTWHNQRAIGWLAEREDVDPARIAVTGASGGGQQSYYLMALEDRLVAAAPVVMACYWHEIISDTSAHCGCNHTPRLAAFTDVPEMCAVFAPKPAFFGSVTGDWTKNFPKQGLPELASHWLRLEATPPRSRHADEDHNFDRPMREAVYGFLHDVFAGAKTPRERMPEPNGGVFSAEQLEPLLRAHPNARLDPSAMAREYLARRPRVGALAALAPGLDFAFERHPHIIEWRKGGDEGWSRGSVDGPDGVPIPFRMHRGQPDRHLGYAVIIDPRGAAMTLMAGPPAVADGIVPVLVDPRPYGEWQPFRSAWQRNGLLLGRGEAYQTAVDIAVVSAHLPGNGPVRLVGLGEAGVPALIAARLCDRIRSVTTNELGPTYAQDGNRRPLAPGLLRLCDLPGLVAGLPAGVRHTIAPSGR